MTWRACGDLGLPFAARGATWDARGADRRVRDWAGGPGEDDIDWAKYRRAFLAYDDAAPDKYGSYKLPFATVEDGQLVAVPQAVMACAGGAWRTGHRPAGQPAAGNRTAHHAAIPAHGAGVRGLGHTLTV